MSISLKDAKYKIFEMVWDQDEEKISPFKEAKTEFINNKVLNDPDYIKDRKMYLNLEIEGYMSYLNDSNYDLDFINHSIAIIKEENFYFVVDTKGYCMRKVNDSSYPNSSYRRYEDFFTEEEQKYIENLDSKMDIISEIYDNLYTRIKNCNSFTELASIPEISNFFDKDNPKKFNRKAKLKDIEVNI